MGVHVVTHECRCQAKRFEVLINNKPATGALFHELEKKEGARRLKAAAIERQKMEEWIAKQIDFVDER